MRKSETTNVFTEGLVMDINPIVTPSNVLCNALNATLITMNGNENALQNDMGNGRVETAYLPEGYVPLGTTQLGGIIYIVSYNPLIDRCQIGSFPSPERNISTEELSDQIVNISNSEFQFQSEGSLKTLLLKKELFSTKDIKVNPGDSFIVYAKNNCLTNNGDTISDFKNNLPNSLNTTPRYIKLSLAAIDDNNKITYLDSDLKWFDYQDGYYIIPELDDKGGTEIPDLDSYRNLIQSPYNIFKSKISGQLILIAELVTIDTFSCTWNAISNLTEPIGGDNSNVTIEFNCTWTDSYNQNIHPKYIILNDVQYIGLENNTPQSGSYFQLYDTDSSEYNNNQQVTIKLGDYEYLNNDLGSKYITYSICPAMPFGKLDYLTTSGSINFSEIGSGKINLSEWRYWVQNNSLLLNFGIEAYPERNKVINGLEFYFYPYDGGDKATMTIQNRSSYNGNFMESISLDVENPNYKIQGVIKSNCLYYVVIKVNYGSEDSDESRYYSRWLYTTPIYNQYYMDEEITDFDKLELNLELLCTSDSQYGTTTITETQRVPPLIIPLESIDTIDNILDYQTLGSHSYQIKGTTNIQLLSSLSNEYNLFKINQDKISYTSVLGDRSIDLSDRKQMHEGLSQDNEILDPIIDLDGSLQLPTNNIWNSSTEYLSYIDNFTYTAGSELNSSSFTLNLEGICHSKMYADMKIDSVSYNYIMSPLIYDKKTMQDNNLSIRDNMLQCDKFMFIAGESLNGRNDVKVALGYCSIAEGQGIQGAQIYKKYTRGDNGNMFQNTGLLSGETDSSNDEREFKAFSSEYGEAITNLANEQFNGATFIPMLISNIDIQDGNNYAMQYLGPQAGNLSRYWPGYPNRQYANFIDAVNTVNLGVTINNSNDTVSFDSGTLVATVVVKTHDNNYILSSNMVLLRANSQIPSNVSNINIAQMILNVGSNLYISKQQDTILSDQVIMPSYLNYISNYIETWNQEITSTVSVETSSGFNNDVVYLYNGQLLNETLINNIKEKPIQEFSINAFISEASNSNVNPIIPNLNYQFTISYNVIISAPLLSTYNSYKNNSVATKIIILGEIPRYSTQMYNANCYLYDKSRETMLEFDQDYTNEAPTTLFHSNVDNNYDISYTSRTIKIYLPNPLVQENKLTFEPAQYIVTNPTTTYNNYRQAFKWPLYWHTRDRNDTAFCYGTNFYLDYETFIFKPSQT